MAAPIKNPGKPPPRIPENWTILGVEGKRKDYIPLSLQREAGPVTYQSSAFGAKLSPSSYIGAYTTVKEYDVWTLFNTACGIIKDRCCKSSDCSRYFMGLGRNLNLNDFLDWTIEWGYWRAISRTGPPPTAGSTVAVLDAEAVAQNYEARYACIIISETSLVNATKLAATMVHELAHVAGAPGASDGDRDAALANRKGKEYRRLIAAELSLKNCLLDGEFHGDAVGALFDIQERMRSTLA